MRSILYLRDHRLFFSIKWSQICLNTINAKRTSCLQVHISNSFILFPKSVTQAQIYRVNTPCILLLNVLATEMSNEKKNKCITSKQRNLISVMIGLIYFYIAFSLLCFLTALSIAGFWPNRDVNRCREESQTWN